MVKKQKARTPALVFVALIMLVIGAILVYGSLMLVHVYLGSIAFSFSSVPLLRMVELDLGAVFVFLGFLVLSVD